ncbi:hypothetical protein V8D89_004360 [Ganoderma adspersum]
MEDYNNHASTLLAIHNSIAQINTLPTDIFQEILVNIPSEASWCNASWMLSLGSVCRHWRSVLLATPEYWVRGLHTVMDPIFYDCYEDEDLTHGRNLFLARSAPCPLEIPMAYSLVDFGQGWVTELVLDLRYAAGDMDGEFWPTFFKALPDVLRLQLLSPTAESRAMKREIAKHYLASCGVPHLVPENSVVDFICRIALPRLAVSLAWVLPCVDHNDVVRMDELEDVLQILMGHTDDEAIALQRLELYLTTLTPDPSGQQAFDVKEACPDGMPSRVIDSIRIPGSRGLEDAAEVVVFGSPLWEFRFAENDHEPDVEGTDDECIVVDDD